MTNLNPFVGPKPLQAGDPIFARNVELQNIAGLLVAERIVLLHSPSGAGKTSLINAGLIKLLKGQEFRVLPVVRVNISQSTGGPQGPVGNKYINSVIDCLEAGLPEAQRRPMRDLQGTRLAAYLDARPRPADADGPGDTDFEILIVDQFEEIITLDPTDRDVKVDFFKQIGDALRNPNRWALFVMREDHVAEVDEFAHLIPTTLATRFRLNLLTRDQAEEAIAGLTAAANNPFDTEVVLRLVNDLATVSVQDGLETRQALGDCVEPVQLQVVCRRLWERRSEGLDSVDLAPSGEVDEALKQFYSDVVAKVAAELDIRERVLRDWIEEHLIIAGTLRGLVMREGGITRGLSTSAVDALSREHLLRSDRRSGRDWIELTHDRLVQPIRDENEQWRKQHLSHFQQQAALYSARGDSEGMLLTGPALKEAEEWVAANRGDVSAEERSYLALCKEEWAQALLLEEKNTQIVKQNHLLAEQNSELHDQQKALVKQRRRAQYGLWGALACSAALLFAMLYATRIAGERKVTLAKLQAATDANERAQRLTQIRQLNADALALPQTQFDKTLTLALQANQLLESALERVPNDAEFLREQRRVRAALISGLVAAPASKSTLFGHNASVRKVAFSPDGKILASGGFDKKVILWDVDAGREIVRLPGHQDAVYSVAFSPDGHLLASADAAGRILLWRVSSTGADSLGDVHAIDGAKGHVGKVTSLAFSADGKKLVSGGWDRSVLVWNVSTPTQPTMIASSRSKESGVAGHESVVYAVAFLQGDTVASADWNGEIRIWRFGSEGRPAKTSVLSLVSTLLLPEERRRGSVMGLAYDRASDRLAASGWTYAKTEGEDGITEQRGRLKVWSSAMTGPKLIKGLGGFGGVGQSIFYGVSLSEGGQVLAVAGGPSRMLSIWQAGSDRRIDSRFQERVYSVAFKPGSDELMAVGGAKRVSVIDARSLQALPAQRLALSPVEGQKAGRWTAVGGSADAQTIVGVTGDQLQMWQAVDTEITGYKATTGVHLSAALTGSLAVNRAATLVAVSAQNTGLIQVFRSDGTEVQLPRPTGRDLGVGYKLAFSPAGDLLAIARGPQLSIYDLNDSANVKTLVELTTGTAKLTAVAFAASGNKLAVASNDSLIRAFNIRRDTGALTPIGEALQLPGESGSSIAFSPDESFIAVGTTDADIWLVDPTGKQGSIQVDQLHELAVTHIAFGVRGGEVSMVSADRDGRILLWDVYGKDVRRGARALTRTSGETPVFLSKSGDFLISGGAKPQVWDFRMKGLISLACTVYSKDIDVSELKEYGIEKLGDPCVASKQR